MTVYASAMNRGFYDDTIHATLPDDAVEIADELRWSLVNGQSEGKFIDWSGDVPVLADPPPPTFEQEVEQFKAAIQHHMDAAAKAAGYDDIKTAVTYAEEPAVPKFQAQGQAFRAWRSLIWVYGYDQLDKVASGERTKPTIDELVAELPALVLPS